MKWAVLILSFAALLADIYIYRSVICACFRKLPFRVAYIVFAVVSDGAALSVLFLYGIAAEKGPGAVMAVMWIIWAFFLTAFPKLFYMAGGFLDHLVSIVIRRRVPVFRSVAIVLGAAGICMMIYGATKGRTSLKVNEIAISSGRLPDAFEGYRIVQISDLHIGTMPRAAERVAEIVETINRLEPDLVVNTGDLINIRYTDLTPEIMSELSRIKAPDGVWSVWGNHELGFYIPDTVALPPRENLSRLSAKLIEMGWNDLTDRYVYIRRGADSILLSGINFPDDDRHLSGRGYALGGSDLGKAFPAAGGGVFSVVLSHAPSMWREIAGAGFGDLVLSGHVHSMQIKLRLFGRSWSPAKYLHPEWSGLYEDREKKYFLYVNDGIGCVGYPMRIGASPEITLFSLR